MDEIPKLDKERTAQDLEKKRQMILAVREFFKPVHGSVIKTHSEESELIVRRLTELYDLLGELSSSLQQNKKGAT